jgi:inner membrane transporter RhtA
MVLRTRPGHAWAMSQSAPSFTAARVPPQAWFVASSVFHYLGPSFAVMLFAAVQPLGVAWLRIVSAAVIFAVWRRPWRYFARLGAAERWTIVALGLVLAGMNGVFYLAIDRLPLGVVGAIEFAGPVALAAIGARSGRNLQALGLAVAGVWMLSHVGLGHDLWGYGFAFANCALFVLYIVLGHRISGVGGIDRLGCAMLVASLAVAPVGLAQAMPALHDPRLLAAGVAVGISSSVIPYVCDQLAMARLPRASFALMLSILPAMATAVGFVVLHQRPGAGQLVGIALVAAAVALHKPQDAAATSRAVEETD